MKTRHIYTAPICLLFAAAIITKAQVISADGTKMLPVFKTETNPLTLTNAPNQFLHIITESDLEKAYQTGVTRGIMLVQAAQKGTNVVDAALETLHYWHTSPERKSILGEK